MSLIFEFLTESSFSIFNSPFSIPLSYLCVMIDQATIQKIFDAADIYEVVSDFVSLKKRGVNYLGLCPCRIKHHQLRDLLFLYDPLHENHQGGSEEELKL